MCRKLKNFVVFRVIFKRNETFFPVAAIADAPTGRIAIYYGAADTYICLAFTTTDECISYIKANPVKD